MFNGTPINGNKGGPGIDAGETMILPYHIAQQLALNLAKHTMNASATTTPQLDANGSPIVKAIWNDVALENMKNSYLKELYAEERPVKMSETDILLAKLEEYRKLTEEKFAALEGGSVKQEVANVGGDGKITYKDKAEIIAELEKRGIVHDKRSKKEDLEALLA